MMDHSVTTRTNIWMKIALKNNLFSKQNVFYCFTPKTFQNTAKMMFMSMQMIYDKMHFDTIALRQKNAIWNVDGCNILSV